MNVVDQVTITLKAKIKSNRKHPRNNNSFGALRKCRLAVNSGYWTNLRPQEYNN